MFYLVEGENVVFGMFVCIIGILELGIVGLVVKGMVVKWGGFGVVVVMVWVIWECIVGFCS